MKKTLLNKCVSAGALLILINMSLAAPAALAPTAAAMAVNALGLDLLRQNTQSGMNALLSPYSIQNALAMTYAGADGATRTEMARVLHYPADDAELHHAFASLRRAIEDVEKKSAEAAKQVEEWGATNDPITLTVANRLFGQDGYNFRETFLALLEDSYAAPFEPL
ncbi:MAG: hypothetical protein H7Y43_02370, partial [Akkermansiaceae bacterium]|nr:hypothetical protein [Verrucomicrobiales bacterium]